jgi:KipI family sensor histidine kinase inhibitor
VTTLGAEPRIVAFGESAVLVVLGETIDPQLNDKAHRLTARIRALGTADDRYGVPVPAYASVLVPFDPLRVDVDAVTDRIRSLLVDDGAAAGPPAGRTIELQTRYGGDEGPDLAEVAERSGLTADQVVELHTSVTYRVYMLGFAPGFAYLGRVPAPIAVPRRDTPRPRVAAGSVAIAGEQTGVYPFASPGGWQLIGRTEAMLWDVDRDPPALLQPGDSVRFVPASR